MSQVRSESPRFCLIKSRKIMFQKYAKSSQFFLYNIKLGPK